MKALLLEDGELALKELPAPDVGPDQALVRISSSGVCHSDLHVARGDWAGLPRSTPLGHEAIGVVEETGPGAERFVAAGQRVILGLGGMGGAYWCGACDYCLSGRPRLCGKAQPLMGTFAEMICVWAPALVALPAEIPDTEAPLACGGLTAFSAVRKLAAHGVAPGRRIAVVGAAGGLGHYAVQIASAFGYRVVGVDVGAERLDFVRSLGAEHCVAAEDAERFAQSELGGVDAALVFAARLAAFDIGLAMLRRGGLFVAVGIPPSSEGCLQVHPWQLFLADPTIIYSAVGTVEEMRELVDHALAGGLKTHVSRTGRLSDIPAIFDELEEGRYLGRAVITELDA